MAKKHLGVCIYCGTAGEVTREHIPSKSLFLTGEGVDFRFVDSCLDCNRGFSKDEEFFRNWLANAHYETSEEATKLFDGPITRSYHKRSALAQYFFNNMQLIDIYNPVTGEYETKTGLTNTPGDKERVNRVVKKYTQGLCAWHFGSRLDSELELKMIQVSLDWLEKNKDTMGRMPLNIVKENVFEYKYGQVPDSQQSMWVLQFYGGSYFVVFVARKDFYT